jgi:hypothetical protein
VEALPEHLLRKRIKKRPGLYRTAFDNPTRLDSRHLNRRYDGVVKGVGRLRLKA